MASWEADAAKMTTMKGDDGDDGNAADALK